MNWNEWDKEKPENGCKIIIACADGCSCSIAIMTDDGPIESEDAWPLSDDFLRSSLWVMLPENFPIYFMERHDDY